MSEQDLDQLAESGERGFKREQHDDKTVLTFRPWVRLEVGGGWFGLWMVFNEELEGVLALLMPHPFVAFASAGVLATLFIGPFIRTVRVTLTARALFVERMWFGQVTSRETIALDSVAHAAVTSDRMRSALELTLVNGETTTLRLGKKSDHETVATWLQNHLQRVEKALPDAMAVPDGIQQALRASTKSSSISS